MFWEVKSLILTTETGGCEESIDGSNFFSSPWESLSDFVKPISETSKGLSTSLMVR